MASEMAFESLLTITLALFSVAVASNAATWWRMGELSSRLAVIEALFRQHCREDKT
jgi:hypothetical protein